jgi:hypothetical protein
MTTFTSDFLDDSIFTLSEFARHARLILDQISNAGLTVRGVMSDGCAFQKKAVSCRPPDSIQGQFDWFSKILFVPCICHRLQILLIVLLKTNLKYQQLIPQAYLAAAILREQANRAVLGKTCPIHCDTRRTYDYSLVRFLWNNFQSRNKCP